MSADSVMEAMLKHDIEVCEQRVKAATPKPVLSAGKLVHRGSLGSLEVAERELAHAKERLERWLSERGQ